MTAPSIKAAEAMGATGSQPVEAERLAFEAWMRGHCWVVGGEWDGKQYCHPLEKESAYTYVDQQTMLTRQLWAAWRDRAALSASVRPELIPLAEQQPEDGQHIIGFNKELESWVEVWEASEPPGGTVWWIPVPEGVNAN